MNTGKQINAMVVVLFITLIAIGAYTIWDPFRSDAAKTTQDDKTATFGAETFTLNCRLCHGDRGEGGQAGGRFLPAPALDRPEFQGIESGAFSQVLFDANRRLITNTITCGRAGSAMPTWGATQGGTLSDEQVRQLTVLITEGHWDLAQEHADETDAIATNHATLAMPIGALSAGAAQLTVSNAGPFTLGQYIRIGDERLRILPKQLDVQRGVDGTTAADHAVGTTILRDGAPVAGSPSAVLSNGRVTLKPGSAATLAEKAPADATALAVGDTAGFAIGDTLQLEGEAVRVAGISRGIPTTGQMLAKGVGRTPKKLLVSGPAGIQEGALIRIDGELMQVTAVRNDGSTGVKLDEDASPNATEISVDQPTFFRAAYQFSIGDEMLQVVGPVDTDQTLAEAIGIAQKTLSVSGSAGIEEGAIIRIDDELFRVKRIAQPARAEIERGVDGTAAAAHATGVVVLKAVEPPTEGQQPQDPTTGQTLLADLTAEATTVDLTGSTKIAVDQKYALEGETVQVKGVEPAVLDVERAVGGTGKVGHARRAPIFDGNRLEVQRGVNGTTASAHSADDALQMTALQVKREAEGSKVAEHSKNAEILLGNDLAVARGVLNTKAEEHQDGALVRNFPAPPDNPATNAGPTCGQLASGGATGPTPTPLANAAKVAISLTEFKVTGDPSSVNAGPVEFDVKNDGVAPHNFRVIQTELDPTKLPVSNSLVDENQVTVVGKSGTITGGGSSVVSIDQLAAGSYVLICNVPTHYQSGMRVAFTVQ